jgi:hypothetical protein
MATQQGDLQMRFSIRILAMLVVLPVVLSKAPANALPYDPYPWCADYSAGNGGGGTNCGFLTIEQCRATEVASADFACRTNSTTRDRRVAATAQGIIRSVAIYPRGDLTSAFKGLVGRARPGTCAKQLFSSFLQASTQSVPGFPWQFDPHP